MAAPATQTYIKTQTSSRLFFAQILSYQQKLNTFRTSGIKVTNYRESALYHVIAEDKKWEVEAAADAAGLDTHSFIKRRTRILGQLYGDQVKDFRKSQNAKRAWRLNRREYMGAIKNWHKSTQGKKFHRQLATFNQYKNDHYEGLAKDEELVAVMSMRTHLMIESRYFVPDYKEHVAFNEFFYVADTILASACEKLLMSERLDEDETNLICELK